MSAYLTTNDCLNALITYWDQSSRLNDAKDNLIRAIAHAGQASTGNYDYSWATNQALRSVDKHGTVLNAAFAELLSENVRSLQARYPRSPEMWEAADTYVFRRSQAVLRWTTYKPYGHGRIVGLANGYAYQSCEHDGWRLSPAYMLINQIKDMLLRDLERRDCQSDTSWASFTEPETTSPLISLSSLTQH